MTDLLLITSEFPPQPGGIGAHAYNLAKYLSLHDHTVTVLTDQRSVEGSEEKSFDEQQGFSIKRIRRKPIIFITYLNRIFKALALVKENSTVLVSGKFSIWMGGIMSLVSNKKIVAVVHGSEVATPNSLKLTYTKWCLRRFQKVITVSTYTKSLISNWGIKHIEVIPNGFTIENEPIAESKEKLGLQLITVGNVTERKGQRNVIKALPKLTEKFPDLMYHIVGIPTEKEKTWQLAKQLKVTDHVFFHGRVTDNVKNKLLRDADLFVMLSQPTITGDVEGFGIAILEANALGLPAIGSKNCGIEDAISEGFSGFLVPYNNPQEIRNAVDKIVKEHTKFSDQALQWSEQFTWEKIINKYLLALK